MTTASCDASLGVPLMTRDFAVPVASSGDEGLEEHAARAAKRTNGTRASARFLVVIIRVLRWGWRRPRRASKAAPWGHVLFPTFGRPQAERSDTASRTTSPV